LVRTPLSLMYLPSMSKSSSDDHIRLTASTHSWPYS
jgi:hypothetical protein